MSSEPQRRLILHMSVSLDGFSAAGRDIPGRLDHGSVRHQANLEMIGQVGLIAIGRGAYQEMAQAWATSDSPMAHLINALPKVVFSTSVAAVDWDNAVLNAGPVEEEIPRLKAEPGGDIVVFGGPRFAHSLIRHRLVDEYRLTVHPIALGAGSALMHGLPEPQRFELVSSTVYTDGSTVQVLRPTAARRDG
jgi:dihydrofolate reductase